MSEQNPKKKKKKKGLKRFIFFLLFLAIAGFIGWRFYTGMKKEYTKTYDEYTANKGTIENADSFTGSVAVINSKTYTASADATVRAIYVSVGDKVKKNDRLARLSDGTTFTADFDGTVNVVEVEKDDEVYSGDTIVQIADFTNMKVTMRIDEYNITDVTEGQDCVITVDSTNEEMNSKISTINYISTVQFNTAYYTATSYITVPEGTQIYPGMSVTVKVPKEVAKDVVTLNMNAISTDQYNKAFVYKQKEDGTMEKTEIEVGISNGKICEIKSGVEEGEKVYVESQVKEESTGLFGSLFGGTQVNAGGMGGNMQGGGHGNWSGGNGGGGMPGGGGGMPGGGGPGGGPGGM